MGTQPKNMCDDEEEKPAVVVDNGSGMMKAGCSGEDAPKVTFSSVVGYPKQKTALVGTDKDYYIGEEAQQKRGYSPFEVSFGARYRAELGRHGEGVAPHLRQRAPRGRRRRERGRRGLLWRASHRGAHEPQGQPRAHD